jgi:undecaprenyl diphosphate synthase
VTQPPSQPPALDPREALGLPPEALPRHIAIIMDGNGRWAAQRGLPRLHGHRAGARAVRAIVTHCARLGIGCLTLYSFSRENWKRPEEEVAALMDLLGEFLVDERQEILLNNIRLRHIGRRDGLPPAVREVLEEVERASGGNSGLTLCIAVDYGARDELARAVRALAERVARGELRPQEIDEGLISTSLDTAGLPDPDLVIRTAGEMRVSNFLLWQISYSELYVSPVLWPDFGVAELDAALREYGRRERRYGAVDGAAEGGL